jgi:hypothetical protein
MFIRCRLVHPNDNVQTSIARVRSNDLEFPVGIGSAFNDRWREVLGGYLRSLPGGEQKSSTVSRIEDLIAVLSSIERHFKL